MMAKQAQTTPEMPRSIGGARQGVKIGVVLAFVLVISVGILLLAGRAVSNKHAEGVENQEKRLNLLAHGRAEVFEAWLSELSRQGDRLIKSDLFRL
ncbi:MAG: histidine kinase, partial [Proteobacteria bacterium]|nr:histidine kinase [Pseudomonadota bacterium]